jgi:hypothetical protein
MGYGKRTESMIEESQCHVIVSEFYVVLCNFDEDVGSTMMTVPKGRLIVHECAAVVV